MKKIPDIFNPPTWTVHYHHLGMSDDCVAYIRACHEVDVFNRLMDNENKGKFFIDSMICNND